MAFSKHNMRVFVEEPTYFLAFDLFRELGLELASVPVDAHGLNVRVNCHWSTSYSYRASMGSHWAPLCVGRRAGEATRERRHPCVHLHDPVFPQPNGDGTFSRSQEEASRSRGEVCVPHHLGRALQPAESRCKDAFVCVIGVLRHVGTGRVARQLLKDPGARTPSRYVRSSPRGAYYCLLLPIIESLLKANGNADAACGNRMGAEQQRHDPGAFINRHDPKRRRPEPSHCRRRPQRCVKCCPIDPRTRLSPASG